jgi:hypothetical protein
MIINFNYQLTRGEETYNLEVRGEIESNCHEYDISLNQKQFIVTFWERYDMDIWVQENILNDEKLYSSKH